MPALGGVISAREFVDLMDFEVESAKRVMMWSGGADHFAPHNSPSEGRILGKNFPGGISVQEQENGDAQVEMMFHSVVNGWLPHSVVSKAMPGTMVTLAKNLREVAKNK
jgi:hypothetical protein